MPFLRNTLIVLLLANMSLSAQAQEVELDLFSFIKTGNTNYSQFAAILLDDEPLINRNGDTGPLSVGNKKRTGTLSVSSMTKSCGDALNAVAPIGFRVAIKNRRTNSLWMYSDDVLFELDLQEVFQQCEAGDQLIFMTVDRKYRLGRHVVVFMDGC